MVTRSRTNIATRRAPTPYRRYGTSTPRGQAVGRTRQGWNVQSRVQAASTIRARRRSGAESLTRALGYLLGRR